MSEADNLHYDEVKKQEQEDVDIDVISVYGRTGLGKTTTAVGEAIQAALEHGKKVIVSNVKLYNLPEGIRCVWTSDVKVIVNAEDCIILWDEADKSASSRGARTIYNSVITKLVSNARKKNVPTLIITAQWRHGVDVLIRTNCKYVIYPNRSLDNQGRVEFYCWNSVEDFENDIVKNRASWMGRVPLMSSEFPLAYLKTCFNTRDKIPIQVIQSLESARISPVTDEFLDWMEKSQRPLPDKMSFLGLILHRWNEEQEIPYNKKALDLVLSELYLRGLLEKKRKLE